MVLDELRARLDRLPPAQGQRSKAGLREALVELKVAGAQSRDALAAAERELAVQGDNAPTRNDAGNSPEKSVISKPRGSRKSSRPSTGSGSPC